MCPLDGAKSFWLCNYNVGPRRASLKLLNLSACPYASRLTPTLLCL